MSKIRCAVYTRKSHEDGLEQDFNSLAAQREACLAYVTSQKAEGWVALPAHYDDGGYSGGTLERPALQKLLADIEAGKIDVVLVYKVDRLTRSLTDFAKIVERLDARGASFVSITQAFNTTSSMGRLTLNVLLSFAQFEREVTGERIRDKIAASKAKGLWMGGNVPLGYDGPAEGAPRILTVNEAEAETVRHIYRRYLELGSVHELRDALADEDIRSKQRVTLRGDVVGGVRFSRGALFHLLKNPVYRGLITHKGATYPGQHEAIIDQYLFDAVQQQLADNARRRTDSKNHKGASLLKGLIFDEAGAPMSPTIAYGKMRRAYRYYVAAPLQCGTRRSGDNVAIRRVAAGQIESLVSNALAKLLGLAEDAGWTKLSASLVRVELKSDSVDLLIEGKDFVQLASRASGWATVAPDAGGKYLRCIIPGRAVFRGGRTWIVGADGQHPTRSSRTDAKLIKALKSAHEWQLKLKASPLTPVSDLALAQPHPDSFVRQLGQLAFLAPDIQQAILDGQQPAGLTIKRLLTLKLPNDWGAQRKLLGFVP